MGAGEERRLEMERRLPALLYGIESCIILSGSLFSPNPTSDKIVTLPRVTLMARLVTIIVTIMRIFGTFRTLPEVPLDVILNKRHLSRGLSVVKFQRRDSKSTDYNRNRAITFFPLGIFGSECLCICTSLPNANTENNAYLKSNSTPKSFEILGRRTRRNQPRVYNGGPAAGHLRHHLPTQMTWVAWQIANISINLI